MTEKTPYTFDWKFYTASFLILTFILGTIYLIKKMIDVSQGKEVQKLLTVSNLDTDEFYQKQAKNYSVGLIAQHKLDKQQAARVQKIFEDAFRDWHHIWMENVVKGKSTDYINKVKRESWDHHQLELNNYLSTIPKNP